MYCMSNCNGLALYCLMNVVFALNLYFDRIIIDLP